MHHFIMFRKTIFIPKGQLRRYFLNNGNNSAIMRCRCFLCSFRSVGVAELVSAFFF